MKMTRAEYLEKRGWTTTNPAWREHHKVERIDWFDPLHVGAPSQEPSGELVAVGCETAVNVQLARDAAEERAAWDRYAAAERAWGGVDGDGNAHCNHVPDAVSFADDMLAERRRRFAVEFTD